VKFHFVDEYKDQFRIRSMCRILGVSRSGYYAWCGRPLPRREVRNEALLVQIRETFRRSRGTYGSPRIHRALRKDGVSCGRHRIARLMQLGGIVAKMEAHFRWTSTKRDDIPAAANLVQRQFHADKPNRVWASDITLLRTGQGWLHLVVILDLYSRRVVGWSMRSRPTQELVVEALQMAIADRRPAPGLIFHSDRGGQYLSYEVQEALDEHGFRASTSRPGNCLDNAVVETFFKTLKTEMYYHRHFATRAEARTAVFDFIATFYNPIRLHSSLDYESPEAYERALNAA
jgi:putative transposase